MDPFIIIRTRKTRKCSETSTPYSTLEIFTRMTMTTRPSQVFSFRVYKGSLSTSEKCEKDIFFGAERIKEFLFYDLRKKDYF